MSLPISRQDFNNYKRSLRNEAALTRSLVLERDKKTCRFCHAKFPLEDHHIRALENGGKNELANRITLCKRCHRFFDGFELPMTPQIVKHITAEMQLTARQRLKDLIK